MLAPPQKWLLSKAHLPLTGPPRDLCTGSSFSWHSLSCFVLQTPTQALGSSPDITPFTMWKATAVTESSLFNHSSQPAWARLYLCLHHTPWATPLPVLPLLA